MIEVRRIIGVLFLLLLITAVMAQEKKKRVPLKDSTDGAFDLSDFVIDANGFIPVPILITEPALGGFGGGIVPIFLKKRPPYIDTIKGKQVITPIAPDITGGAAMYTLNGTWALAAFRSGTLVKSRIKYVIGGGYVNVNISFFRTIQGLGEKEFKYNLRSIPIRLQGIKRIAFSHWYAGLRYSFFKTDAKYIGDKTVPPDFVSSKENSSLVSQLGAILELDNRDNNFTPNRGFKVHFDAMRSDNIFGSDYEFWHLNYYMNAYSTISKKFVVGWRVDGQQAFGEQPFYLKPYIDMRGVPTARYQGNADLLTELETRWDFYRRWSVMLFGGTGKAFDNWDEISDAKWVNTIGTGFRYLMARKFKLRVGIDFAKGPDNTFAYYIVFGNTWVK